MTFHLKRGIACIAVGGLLLAACGSTASPQSAPSNQRQLEATACKLISATSIPPPNSGSFVAISVQTSTLRALQKTNDASLTAIVRAYDKAAEAPDEDAMIRALNNGVKVCHGLGLKTAT
jgi:predicted component of type VI protein secretion system